MFPVGAPISVCTIRRAAFFDQSLHKFKAWNSGDLQASRQTTPPAYFHEMTSKAKARNVRQGVNSFYFPQNAAHLIQHFHAFMRHLPFIC
ncbi:MAG: Uncharacterised protein [Flavobacteriia bacterium]|nr:MAG: Uncharacterised protein [Flavobacteriia bacterium]